ncbi:MAG: hypothetical protein O6913_06930 [Chloroflexi bacterium]|nr:hypothetical protein [Chloroflexota bacterium]
MRLWKRVAAVLLFNGILLAFGATAVAQGPDDHAPDCAPGACAEQGQGDPSADAGPPDDAGAAADGAGALVVTLPGMGVESLSLPASASGQATPAIAASHPLVQAHVAGLMLLMEDLHAREGAERAAVAQRVLTDVPAVFLCSAGPSPNEPALCAAVGGAHAE